MHLNVARPENISRSLFHVTSALVALVCIEALPTKGLIAVAGGFAGFSWLAETLRRRSAWVNAQLMKVFNKVAHPHEHKEVNSSTWYCTALFGLALTSPPMVCALGVVVLGLADPAAAAVGRRWGRTRLACNRSLEGSLTFVAVGALASFGLLALRYPELPASTALVLALGAALAGALAELGARNMDDNFVIPLAAAAGATLVVSWVV